MEKIKKHILTLEMYKNRISFIFGILFTLIIGFIYFIIEKLPDVGWIGYSKHRGLPVADTLRGSLVGLLILVLFVIGYFLMQFLIKKYINFLAKKINK